MNLEKLRRIAVSWVELGWIGLSWVELGWLGLSWVGLSWVELGWVGLSWVELGWIGSSWVELGWVGLSWVELGWVGLSWVELGWVEVSCGELWWEYVWLHYTIKDNAGRDRGQSLFFHHDISDRLTVSRQIFCCLVYLLRQIFVVEQLILAVTKDEYPLGTHFKC
jgi:hypothetical protein